MTINAVHLEKVDGLRIYDFIAALRRFIAFREHPSVISSDNDTNNKMCELYKLVQQPEHSAFLIGRPLLALPEPEQTEVPINCLT